MNDSNCSPGACGCEPRISRRDLLQIAGAAAVSQGLPHLGHAGEFIAVSSADDFEKLIPADKGLSQEWRELLTTRTTGEIFRGWDRELKYIGMPVGGIGCGQLYLGGDGRLWLWDIFKCNYRREPDHGQRIAALTLGGHYARPVAFGEEYNKWNGANVEQGFGIRVESGGKTWTRSLDRHDFPEVAFRGEYPIGKVTYRDQSLPIEIDLQAFSPFIPLNAQDSGLPATVLRFTVSNVGAEPAEVDLVGWLQNATCPYVADATMGRRRNRLVETEHRTTLLMTVEPTVGENDAERSKQPDIVFADFENQRYEGWTATGGAFGSEPQRVDELPGYVDLSGANGEGVVHSHNTRQFRSTDAAADEVAAKVRFGDGQTGTLTSEPFTISRDYISFLISGGSHDGKTCLRLLIDDREVASQPGEDDHQLRLRHFDVRKFAGSSARLQVVDEVKGGWGNVCVDRIVFTDEAPRQDGIDKRHGFGSMGLSLLKSEAVANAVVAANVNGPIDVPTVLNAIKPVETNSAGDDDRHSATQSLDKTLVGALGGELTVQPGESTTLDFTITWYFPDYHEVDATPGFLSQLRDFPSLRRHYAPRFDSAGGVAEYVAAKRDRLIGDTLLWNRTWYDSTLPHWLLDRTFVSLDCVATHVLHWFDSGRLYGWEGVDCCPGTCTHVWHYAQGLSRIFPELERSFRELTDYGLAFNDATGLIGYRAESSASEATDGQAGTILRAYREHCMSADDEFLRRLWPRIKKSIRYLIAKDSQREGLLRGAQPHTLDAAWFGPMAWVSGLYLSAVAAGAAMADEMADAEFSEECRGIVESGRSKIVEELFNGEYFVHKPDPRHPSALRSGNGCHIDQVLGQAWAHQVGLSRVIPEQETRAALESLWRYNFAPDAGAYAIAHREIEQAFRWYAMPGEAGLLMCTWPKGGAREAIPGDRLRPARNPDVWTGPGGYFNECMNGFEYQAAAHMIFEGGPDSDLVEKGLAVTRAIHERYGATKRNPYNEIECSDHYARSMASYGVFLAVCGFEYHGPSGHIGFAPRITPEDFRAPFTAAKGWGTYSQTRQQDRQSHQVEVKWGRLRVVTIAFALPDGVTPKSWAMVVGDQSLDAELGQQGQQVMVRLREPITLNAGDTLQLELDL